MAHWNSGGRHNNVTAKHKTVEETARNKSVAGKAEGSRVTTKVTSTVLRSSCVDSDGNSEHFLDSDSDFLCSRKWCKAVKSRESRSTKVQCLPFYLCVPMKV